MPQFDLILILFVYRELDVIFHPPWVCVMLVRRRHCHCRRHSRHRIMWNVSMICWYSGIDVEIHLWYHLLIVGYLMFVLYQI